MQELISELTRLYLSTGPLSPETWEQHFLGQSRSGISLMTVDGMTRAMAIPFDKCADSEEAQHWSLLCQVANALQVELGLPAPAVSISGANGFCLWLSFEAPVPAALVRTFLQLLCDAYLPNSDVRPEAAIECAELPPCLHASTGKWAAFIHPGLGASFADESGLEMAPPFAGQAALLENLKSITEAQFSHALSTLQQSHGAARPDSGPVSGRAAAADGLLLKDATLEDIVAYLHSKNIEPTFRHLLRK